MGSVPSVIEVDWMSSIQVLSLRSSISIAGVDGSCVVCRVQHERVAVLAQSVEVWLLREVCFEVDVLTLKNQIVASGIKENLAAISSRNSEGERVGVKVELQIAVLGGAPLTESRSRENIIRNLVHSIVGVGNFDVQSVVGLILDLELQVRKVGSEDITRWPGK